MDIKYVQLEFSGNGEEFASAVEQVCYSVNGKGVQIIEGEYPSRGLPPRIQIVKTASNNLLNSLRVPEILALFDGAQFEQWHYVSRDQVNFDGITVSVECKSDHVLEPPDPPLWDLNSNRIAEGYFVRIPMSNQILSLCLHATTVRTGSQQVVRRVEFRAMSRDAKKYVENWNKIYHPRRWDSQKIIPAVAFNLGPTANGKTAIDAEYYAPVEPFYEFMVNELQGILTFRHISSTDHSESKSLSGSDMERLHTAILKVFSESELKRLLRTKLEKKYEETVEGSNKSEKFFSLLEWAGRYERWGELICVISEARPKNQILKEYAVKYGC